MTDRILLVDNIHARADELFADADMTAIDKFPGTISEPDLIARAGDAALIGVRSRTHVTADLLNAAPNMLAVGAYCIGVNQIATDEASRLGVPVFNAPFANARSVAELTIGNAIMLMRDIPAKMAGARRGEWLKAARGSHEVRKKKLGIIGYGNIGSQLSVMASGLGVHVFFYDVEPKLSHGNAKQVGSLDELLAMSDIITLHVPSTPANRNFMNRERLMKMKKGAVLMNLARGDLVDIDALVEVLDAGHLAGAALDVFPSEPASNSEPFSSPLQRFDNVILTPHIGGSTQEAQQAIGEEVTEKLIGYVKEGATAKAVNFPHVAPPPRPDGVVRIAHVHRNVPGVMRAINDIAAGASLNISAQHLDTKGEIGYAVTDLEGAAPSDLAARFSSIEGTVRLRVLGGT
ncbi:MAG: phosphoglycerate dehydrogenase [Caulobacterales bacterium]|nr:phosphoglycerate dehydrogenase [Caulobacterales bacterium]